MMRHVLAACIWIAVLIFVGTHVSNPVPAIVPCDTDSDCQAKNGGNGDPE